MIFVDTNYFLRFLLLDNRKQSEDVLKVFRRAANGGVRLCTSLIVIFEIYWVLSSFYHRKKEEVVQILTNILSLSFIDIAEREVLFEALDIFSRTSLDFEDSYNLAFALSAGVADFYTFDKKLLSAYKKHCSRK